MSDRRMSKLFAQIFLGFALTLIFVGLWLGAQ